MYMYIYCLWRKIYIIPQNEMPCLLQIKKKMECTEVSNLCHSKLKVSNSQMQHKIVNNIHYKLLA